MNDKIVCSKCDGAGCVRHYDDDGFWTEYCSACGGRGVLQRSVLKDDDFEDNGVTFDELVKIINNVRDEMVTITKQEYEELLEYKRKHEWLSTDAVSRDLLEQYKWERNIAIGQLEELGLSLGQKVEYANVVSRKQYEELREAFIDFVFSGVNNPAPYCKNRCDECVDGRGWCTYQRCNGFNPDGRLYDEV